MLLEGLGVGRSTMGARAGGSLVLAVAILALVVGVALAAGAPAPAGLAPAGLAPVLTPATPATPDTQSTPQAQPPDSSYTPSPQSTAAFSQVGGAVFPGETPSPSTYLEKTSPTPVSVDFFATAFRGPKLGFAAGAACDPATTADKLGSCARSPAVYRYTDRPGEGPLWQKVDLPGADTAGFIGGVAFVRDPAEPADVKVLAVGGDGSYPRLEPARNAGESDARPYLGA